MPDYDLFQPFSFSRSFLIVHCQSFSGNRSMTIGTIVLVKQGRIHGYLSRVRLGRGSNKSLQASKQLNPRSKIDVTDQPSDRPTDGPT